MKPAGASEALAWRTESKGLVPLPRGYVSLLEAAGDTTRAAQLAFAALHALAIAAGGLAGVWFGLTGSLDVAPLAFGALDAGLGWWLPMSYLEGRREQRRREIAADMPAMLDLLQLSLQGSMGLAAAWSSAATHLDSNDTALAQEMRRVDLEVSLGGNWSNALAAASARTGVQEFRALGQLLEQTERFGTEMARMVAVQCDSLRHAELQELEEKAHEASVKMLFPLTALLLPATLLLIIGPLLMMLFDALQQTSAD
jgi:tight adherence protein C